MDGKSKSIHGIWVLAIHAGMTGLENSGHVIEPIVTKQNFTDDSLPQKTYPTNHGNSSME
ncbi:MAG: hypothetical protein HOO93_13020 [Methyloglobulus sp.]|nr:hypothetical protein [Methyloglobulus sp.]